MISINHTQPNSAALSLYPHGECSEFLGAHFLVRSPNSKYLGAKEKEEIILWRLGREEVEERGGDEDVIHPAPKIFMLKNATFGHAHHLQKHSFGSKHAPIKMQITDSASKWLHKSAFIELWGAISAMTFSLFLGPFCDVFPALDLDGEKTREEMYFFPPYV